MTADALIVGAGIVGAACAAELAALGMRVEVLDAQGIGGGATAAGMGHIVVMNDSPAEFALSRYSRDLWLALAPQLRTRDAFARCGTLWVAADDEEWQAARAMHAAFEAQGVTAQLLDAASLRACEPALAASMAGGLRIEHDSIVYAPTAAEWLLTQSSGVEKIRVRLGTRVAAISARGVTLADGERVSAEHVIVANGLGAQQLLPSLPLQPKKGHLLITDRYPGLVRHQLLELGYIKSAHHAAGTSVAFNAQPRPTGQLLIGSSRQFDTTDPAVDMPVLAQMLQRAARYLPVLPTLNGIRAWTGFRAASPDGLPLIGPAGDFAPGVWLAVGHEGLGVTTSLATAKLLAAQITGTLHRFPSSLTCRSVLRNRWPMADADATYLHLAIDDRSVEVEAGTIVAAALAMAGAGRTRTSVSGEPRAALCGMGICQECRVTIDGRAHVLACQTLCRDGQVVCTAAAVANAVNVTNAPTTTANR